MFKRYRIRQDIVTGDVVWIVEKLTIFGWLYVPESLSFSKEECDEKLRIIINPKIEYID